VTLLLSKANEGTLPPIELVRQYSWSCPTDRALDLIAEFSPRGVVEIGAGTGYWAFELARRGVNVRAYDVQPRFSMANRRRSWHRVEARDHRAVKRHQDRTLMVVWPTRGGVWAEQALRAYTGRTFIYVGPNMDSGECCATPSFHQLLADEWRLEQHMALPRLGTGGVNPRPMDQHDQIRVYRRKT
jgi:SAM-dependent methyltransferase